MLPEDDANFVWITARLALPRRELRFQFARSSGPGGQNVNKVNSKALLYWHVATSAIMTPDLEERFLAAFKNRMTAEGDVFITSDSHRDQARNAEECVAKLVAMLTAVAVPPRKRKKTKPTRGSTERRHAAKKQQGEKKRQRQRVGRGGYED